MKRAMSARPSLAEGWRRSSAQPARSAMEAQRRSPAAVSRGMGLSSHGAACARARRLRADMESDVFTARWPPQPERGCTSWHSDTPRTGKDYTMKLAHLVAAALAISSGAALAANNQASQSSSSASQQPQSTSSSQQSTQAQGSQDQGMSSQGNSADIRQAQQALQSKGFDVGTVDGKMGPKT